MSLRHRVRRALALALTAIVWLPASGQQEAVSEQAVRAALAYNFIKFADLPAAPQDDPVDLCVASVDPELMEAMAMLKGRQVRGRPLSVHDLGRGAVARRCDVLYVDARPRWQALGERHGADAALTIGAYPGFVLDGGMVELDLQQGRARFDIDNARARRAGIRFSPQLLRLARRVLE